MTDDPRYEPLIHLSTDIQLGATAALVAMGKMLAWRGVPANRADALATIEKKLTKMVRSVADYRRAVGSGRTELTMAEYSGAEESTQ